MVQAKILLLFKDSQTLQNIDHMTFCDKLSLNYLNSEYIRIMTVLCQSNKRHKTGTVKTVFKRKKKRKKRRIGKGSILLRNKQIHNMLNM